MKRLHVHIAVEDLEKSIGFYSTLFGEKPSKQKPGYAKWMLNDPRVNFAISARGAKPGLDHLGIQVDAPEELEDLREHLKRADLGLFDEGEATCCYAESDKSWVRDPSGIAWEAYHTMADAELFSVPKPEGMSACCAPKMETKPAASSCGTAKSDCC
jgi:catechol 2,3-dioxygenase-like lactoylglutathione lyase family enzyme